MPSRINFKRKRLILAYSGGAAIQRGGGGGGGGGGVGEEAWVGAVRQAGYIYTQEAEREQEMVPGWETSRPAPRDPHPPARLHLLKVPSPPVLQPGHKGSVTLCGVIHTTACLILMCWPVVTMQDAVD